MATIRTHRRLLQAEIYKEILIEYQNTENYKMAKTILKNENISKKFQHNANDQFKTYDSRKYMENSLGNNALYSCRNMWIKMETNQEITKL